MSSNSASSQKSVTPKQSSLSKELKGSTEKPTKTEEQKEDTPSSPREEADNNSEEDSGSESDNSGVITGVALPGTVFADPTNFSIKHPLNGRWTLWWDSPKKKASQDTWGQNLNKICDFDTVEDFWRLYNNILPASKLTQGSDYHLFRFGVEPKWEDKANSQGGKWVFTNTNKQRGKLDEMWLYTILSLIGESYGDYEHEVCGAVVSVRKGQDRLALWTRNSNHDDACISIGKTFKQSLNLPDKSKIGYQTHNDSMRRNSSFGNKSKYEV